MDLSVHTMLLYKINPQIKINLIFYKPSFWLGIFILISSWYRNYFCCCITLIVFLNQTLYYFFLINPYQFEIIGSLWYVTRRNCNTPSPCQIALLVLTVIIIFSNNIALVITLPMGKISTRRYNAYSVGPHIGLSQRGNSDVKGAVMSPSLRWGFKLTYVGMS